MNDTIVVALELQEIRSLPFEKQLILLEEHINKIAKTLENQFDEVKEWVIIWPEYGLTNGATDRYLSSYKTTSSTEKISQKAQFKAVMQRITKNFPKLNIVAGTIATKHFVDLADEATASHKIAGIKKAYAENTKYSNILLEHQNQSLIAINQNFDLVRNTCYWFFQGECVRRHDKILPWRETHLLSQSLFRPGSGRSHPNVFDKRWSLEICMEHPNGLLANTSERSLIQLVISSTTTLRPRNCVSPYVLYVDSDKPFRLITDIDAKNQEISLYAYKIEAQSWLRRIYPQTKEAYILDYVSEEIEQCSEELNINSFLLDNEGHNILTLELHTKYCMQFLSSAMSKYIHNYSNKLNKKNINLEPTLQTLLSELAPQQKFMNEETKKQIINIYKIVTKNHNMPLRKLIYNQYPDLFDIFPENKVLPSKETNEVKFHCRCM